MFRPPFLARVAAGAAAYALEETRRLPATAINFPITAISQMLQTTMHLQQFVTSLALKGDAVFDRLLTQSEEQPAWATFDEDEDDELTPSFATESAYRSRFDLFTEPDPAPVPTESAAQEAAEPVITETVAAATASKAATNGHNGSAPAAVAIAPAEPEVAAEPEPAEPEPAAPEPAVETEVTPEPAVAEPAVATRFAYSEMTIAQLRARLRQLTVDDLVALLAYEQETRDRAPFVTMLTNRIATVRAQ
ncbi:lipid droplet-associated protein [Nocardia tengchongensis]|uniref:Lipid droplet-associated protein n=1 Tax=Nocardia tengchongensis TaxID=2055889 RepID=A0ABX8CUD1_9NOCA|nr:lipid droplet-associated protein [Nocardia tengchongensis]QVI23503.1 lipid droplet-associated protein [Nocardia tengchongensis]